MWKVSESGDHFIFAAASGAIAAASGDIDVTPIK